MTEQSTGKFVLDVNQRPLTARQIAGVRVAAIRNALTVVSQDADFASSSARAGFASSVARGDFASAAPRADFASSSARADFASSSARADFASSSARAGGAH